MKPRATQKDVAEAAGVSQTLVSLVLSGNDVDVSDSTRQRILAEARRLKYRIKKRPPAKKRNLLAYLRPIVKRGHHQEHWIYDSYEEYYNRIQNFLCEEARKEGYTIITHPETDFDTVSAWLEEWEFDGVLTHSLTPQLVNWINERFSLLLINSSILANADAVATNQEEVILLPLEHLFSLGHTRIADLSAHPTNNTLRRRRRYTFDEFISDRGLPSYLKLESDTGDAESIIADGIECFLKLMNLPEKRRPSAIICGDHLAIALINKAREIGVCIPDNLSIIGHDNISASSIIEPSLCTIDPCNEELARIAIAQIIARIRHPNTPYQKRFITPKLVIRSSIAQAWDASLVAAN